MSKYDWAANPLKLNRAIGVVTLATPKGEEVSEAKVKEKYVEYAGLVREVGESAALGPAPVVETKKSTNKK